MIIDWQFIEKSYHDILSELSVVIPLKHWSIKPGGIILTQQKTKYGMADLDGVVHINQAFISTQSFRLLDATLRHEFAHLCIGLHHQHDAQFKKTASLFKSSFKSINEQEFKEISNHIGFKFELYAVTNDGSQKFLKKVHRKHPKYTQYKPSWFKYMSLNGKKISKFRYVTIEEHSY